MKVKRGSGCCVKQVLRATRIDVDIAREVLAPLRMSRTSIGQLQDKAKAASTAKAWRALAQP
eukprot:3750745-Amphidinium_carterae.1